MPAETVKTYTFTPGVQSIFTPSGDPKKGPKNSPKKAPIKIVKK